MTFMYKYHTIPLLPLAMDMFYVVFGGNRFNETLLFNHVSVTATISKSLDSTYSHKEMVVTDLHNISGIPHFIFAFY